MQNGLPVVANVNVGNDLSCLIRDEQVGQVGENNRVVELVGLAERALKQVEVDLEMLGGVERCLRMSLPLCRL